MAFYLLKLVAYQSTILTDANGTDDTDFDKIEPYSDVASPVRISSYTETFISSRN